MKISITLVFLALTLLVALLLKPLATRFNIPFAGLLVITGFMASELVVGFGVDTGIRYDSYYDLILVVFLPLLIFEAAFKINAKNLLTNLVIILFLAVPVMLFSTAFSALTIYYGIDHPTGFPWIAALLTGALLAATDPLAVVELMRKAGVPERLLMLLEGEALFNDATAIVSFSIFLYIAQHPLENISLVDASLRFMLIFLGGAMTGLIIGLVFVWLAGKLHDFIQQALVTLIAAYISYLTAQQWFELSGVMSVLVTGMILGRAVHDDLPEQAKNRFVDDFWSFNVYAAQSLMFLLMGVTITTAMFVDNWLAMLIAIVAVIVARMLAIFAGMPLITLIARADTVPFGQQSLMVMGGCRGAVTLALALSLPVDLDYWWTIQSIGFGVVLFTIFVQAPLLTPLLKYQSRQ